MTLRIVTLAACLWLLMPLATSAAGNEPAATPVDEGAWGDARGQFLYDGEPPEPKRIDTSREPLLTIPVYDERLVVNPDSRGIANIVVYLRSLDAPVHPDYAATAENPVVLRIENGRFVPRVLPLRLSQKLLVQPDGKVPYNANFASPLERSP